MAYANVQPCIYLRGFIDVKPYSNNQSARPILVKRPGLHVWIYALLKKILLQVYKMKRNCPWTSVTLPLPSKFRAQIQTWYQIPCWIYTIPVQIYQLCHEIGQRPQQQQQHQQPEIVHVNSFHIAPSWFLSIATLTPYTWGWWCLQMGSCFRRFPRVFLEHTFFWSGLK